MQQIYVHWGFPQHQGNLWQRRGDASFHLLPPGAEQGGESLDGQRISADSCCSDGLRKSLYEVDLIISSFLLYRRYVTALGIGLWNFKHYWHSYLNFSRDTPSLIWISLTLVEIRNDFTEANEVTPVLYQREIRAKSFKDKSKGIKKSQIEFAQLITFTRENTYFSCCFSTRSLNPVFPYLGSQCFSECQGTQSNPPNLFYTNRNQMCSFWDFSR